MRKRWWTRVVLGRYVAAGLLLAYTIVIAEFCATGLGDTPNHLARAYIMADLIFHHGAGFGAQFQFQFQAVPYVLPDLLLSVAVELLGPRIAVASWTVLTFLSVPAALLLYFRVTLGTKDTALFEDEGALFLLLCAVYLSTDLFFVVGFFVFNLGLACVIVILTVIELLRRRWSSGLFALYAGLVVAGYLIHLSTLVFLATIVAVSGVVRLWFRTTSWRHELLLLVPIVMVLAWHFGVAAHYRRHTDLAGQAYVWGTVNHKWVRAMVNFHRYGGRLDLYLEYLYVVCLLMLIGSRAWRDTFAAPRAIECLVVAAAFVGMYFVLPFSYNEASFIDIRALAPATLFLLLACLHLPRAQALPVGSRRLPSLAVMLALALSIVNLGYLGTHFVELSRWSMKYRALFASIPRGARVLPIYTAQALQKFMEPSAIAVIDRQVFFPYLFSANAGQPMSYFRYVNLPYRPADDWYMRGPPLVDWHEVACAYQYILVTQPFDLRRIGVTVNPMVETSSAALLAIEPHACGV